MQITSSTAAMIFRIRWCYVMLSFLYLSCAPTTNFYISPGCRTDIPASTVRRLPCKAPHRHWCNQSYTYNPHSYTHTLHIHSQSYGACLYDGGGNRSTRRKPTQARGEHANSTQKRPGTTGIRTQDLCAVRHDWAKCKINLNHLPENMGM